MRNRHPCAFPTVSMLCFLAGLGCGPGFEPVARLTRLRVLAIGNAPVNPDPGQVTTFEPLVYAPPATAGQAFSYAWTWCPVLGEANDGYTCPISEAQIAQLRSDLGLDKIPSLSLGSYRTLSFTNPFPAAVLAEFCARGFEGTVPDCEGGFPVRVKVEVVNGDARQTATTILRLPIAAGVRSNANPRFDSAGPALTVLLDGAELSIDQQAVPTLPRWKETELRAHVADAEAETYAGTDDKGQPATLRERLVLSWFVETGDVATDSHNTGYIPGQTEIAQFLANKWKPATSATYEPDRAQLIVVLRDNRGGVSWASGFVHLEPTP